MRGNLHNKEMIYHGPSWILIKHNQYYILAKNPIKIRLLCTLPGLICIAHGYLKSD